MSNLDRWSTLRARYEAAVAACDAARVPDADRNGPGFAPVTVTGWYQIPTVSGRAAWVHYSWRNGRCYQGVATYDPALEDARLAAELNYEPWDRAERVREGRERIE